jgi:hypothetical protein
MIESSPALNRTNALLLAEVSNAAFRKRRKKDGTMWNLW